MAFLKVGVPHDKDRRLYCMRITMPDSVWFKFGVASGPSSKNRMLQIAASYYDLYRETPVIKIMRDRKIDGDVVFKKENILHKFFGMYQYTKTPFDGSTELFDIEIDPALQAYDAVVAGDVPVHVYQKEEDQLPESFGVNIIEFIEHCD